MRKVIVKYEDLPAIITMEEAIEAGSYHSWSQNKIETGEVDKVMAAWDPEMVVEGEQACPEIWTCMPHLSDSDKCE